MEGLAAGARVVGGAETFTTVAAAIAATAAALAAMGYIARLVRRLVRIAAAVEHVVTNELTHNHGSSIKDDVYGIAVAVGELSRRVDEIETNMIERHRQR